MQKQTLIKDQLPVRDNSLWWNILNVFIVAVIIVIGAYYMVGINDLTVKGFALQKLKNQSNSLNNKNKEEENKMMVLESYDNLSSRVAQMNLVAVEDVKYITFNNSLAAR